MYWHRTAVEVRNSDWSSDVCSSVLGKLHRPHPGLEAGVAGEHAHPGGHVVPGGGVEHVLAAVGADAGFGCRRGAAQFEAGAFARAGALVATTQFLKRHLPVEAVEAGPVQVRIGTADGAHGISVKPAGAAWAAMAER